MKMLAILIGMAFLFAAISCGGGGGEGNQPSEQNKPDIVWDQSKWDAAKWK